jgi:Protein kinase domain
VQALGAGDPRYLGPYRLHARLGRGGMGQVFLGFSPAGRSVAVKVLHPALAGDEAFLARFGVEVAAARAVSAVYTAPVVAAGLEDDPPWLATAFVPGPSLAELVELTGPLAEAALWRLTAGLVEALAAIHDRAVVHRDLKPSNVLLADDGPRVIDFGLAGALPGAAPDAGGLVIGSPPFMSPEQARGALAGAAGDVFSLGAVIAFASTGSPPFGHGPPREVLYRVLHAAPMLDGLPAGLRQIAAACLAKAPADRPALPELARAVEAGLEPGQGASATSFWPAEMSNRIRACQAGPQPAAATEATQVLELIPVPAGPDLAGRRRPPRRAAAILGTAAAAAAAAAIAVALAPSHGTPGDHPRATAGRPAKPSRTPAPPAGLPGFLNNIGISDDTDPATGNLDGDGSSYSAQALAAAQLTPGATVSHDGVTFTWPDAAPGSADNVIADGQTIGLPGTGATLGILGTSDYGTATGTGTIRYADGSTQHFTISFPDWWSNTPPPNGDVLTTLPYLNTPGGQEDQADSIYYIAVPLAPGKTVRTITLPKFSPTAAQGSPAMHIFALSIGG